jgi:hypothetical protein
MNAAPMILRVTAPPSLASHRCSMRKTSSVFVSSSHLSAVSLPEDLFGIKLRSTRASPLSPEFRGKGH